ncbi:MAG: 2-C-methyl-D-erythritol 2,4-cyclodiphosphate synthase [Flavobacteriia bacterium]|nr:2-C-methyl-D-erythritol 2,4-cyclodiphosphate synthase [Flavobacteriia bacterium]NBX38509.1 2-C-methyl-D-erythritol 2,4-cyclodiphosphate synthase [Flavobacteriia bacterium]
MSFRIGFGVDVHRLVDNRPLVIGGINVPSSLGALGHSDADVLLHAICDALLGALNLRDIGFHFSDKDPAYKGIDSKILLKKTFALIEERGFSVVNLDSTVILERPKLNPFIPEMQQVIAAILNVALDCISIKATTHESVDSFGENLALKAYATVLLQKQD